MRINTMDTKEVAGGGGISTTWGTLKELLFTRLGRWENCSREQIWQILLDNRCKQDGLEGKGLVQLEDGRCGDSIARKGGG